MAMALKQDVHKAQIGEGRSRPIDLVHLGNQTQGDQSLEAEILGIFKSQSQIYLNMMLKSCDVTTRIRAAHSLKGAARSIGAFHLSELAAEVEHVRHDGYENLQAELAVVNSYIDSLQ